MEQHIVLHALLLGVLEGLTEFIPVSSTGHLILAIDYFGIKLPPGRVFEIVIQLGAILAVCWAYRIRLLGVAGTLHSDPESRLFARNILLAFLPAAILGAYFHGFIKEVLFSPVVVSVSLIIGGLIILAVESNRVHIKTRHREIEKFPALLALGVGLCQALAMIPGTSRSGATIIGAMLLGVERKTATEFSFFLAIPTMLGATVYDIYKNYALLDFSSYQVIAVGFIAAFFAALLTVRWVITYISRHGFQAFGWYRISLGAFMLWVFV